MKIDEDNFIRQLKYRNSKALDFIVDEYSNLVFKIIRTVLNSNFHSQYVEECANDVFGLYGVILIVLMSKREL